MTLLVARGGMSSGRGEGAQHVEMACMLEERVRERIAKLKWRVPRARVASHTAAASASSACTFA